MAGGRGLGRLHYRLAPFLTALMFVWTLPRGATGGPSVVGLPMGPGLRMEPYFAQEDFNRGLVQNVTVDSGTTAYFECQVRNLGAKRVSWVRHRDVHILAVGGVTFASDERMSAKAFEDSGRFIFSIRDVRPFDEGAYECQISTKPTKAFLVNLFVRVPTSRILGESAIHVERNSALNLTCVLRGSGLESGGLNERDVLIWYKNGKPLTSPDRVDIVETRSKAEDGGSVVQSRLTVEKADLRDSGNYTCRSSSTLNLKPPPSAVKVHVLVDGESPNAWKTSSSSSTSSSRRHFWISEPILFIFFTFFLNGR